MAYRQQPLVYLGGLRGRYGYSELVKELPEAADLHLRHGDLPLFKALPVGQVYHAVAAEKLFRRLNAHGPEGARKRRALGLVKIQYSVVQIDKKRIYHIRLTCSSPFRLRLLRFLP